MDLPLGGRTVLVLRAPERARPLAERLRGLGADVVVAPVTTTAPPESSAALDAALEALGTYSWVAVTSVNAVDALVGAAARTGVALAGPDTPATGSERASEIETCDQAHVSISDTRSDRRGSAGSAGPRWAAVGPATARALRGAGLAVALEARGTAVDLVAAFSRAQREPTGATAEPPAGFVSAGPQPDGPASGRRVLLPLGDLARTVLADGLRASGWEVDSVVAYRTVPVALPDDVAAAARAGHVDVAVVAAGSAARELARQLGDAVPPVVAIGEPSAGAARAAGLTVVGVAEHPTDEALADALCAAAANTTRSDA